MPESDHIINVVRKHLYHNVGELIIEIGTPNAAIKTYEGNYYTWIKESKTSHSMHGYHYKDPITNFLSEAAVENVVESEDREVIYECKLTIGTDQYDVIISYHLSGKCNKRNTFID